MSLLQEAVDKFILDTNVAHSIIHGPNTLVVQTEGGPVRSIAKLIKDIDDETRAQIIENADSLLAEVEIYVDQARQYRDEAEAIVVGDVIGDDLPPSPIKFYSSEAMASADEGANLIGYAPNTSIAPARTVKDKLDDFISAKDYGVVGDGVTDDSEAFSSMWADIRNKTSSYGTNSRLCVLTVYIPPGVYRIESSINFTNVQAWNIHVQAGGVVFLGNCPGMPVIDACNTRGLHIHGLAVHGDQTNTPSCAILVSPAGTQTCGNNNFANIKTTGYFTVAAFANLGSETTIYSNCYFANNQTGDAFAYVADASNNLGITSQYVTLREPGVAVSFTQNAFYSCHFRNYGGGDGTYLEGTNGWSFDSGCYHLVFSGANFQIRQSSVIRNTNLSLRGLFESAQSPGVDYCVRFVLDGTAQSALTGFEFIAGSPHAKVAVFRLEGPDGLPLGTAGLKIRGATIKIGGTMAASGTPKVFSGTRLEVIGDVHVATASMLNLDELLSYHGVVYVDNANNMTLPTTGNHSFVIFDEVSLSGQVVRIGGANGQVGLQGGTLPRLRAEGPNDNYDLQLQGKGTGLVRFGTFTSNVDATINGFITIKDANGTTRKLATIA